MNLKQKMSGLNPQRERILVTSKLERQSSRRWTWNSIFTSKPKALAKEMLPIVDKPTIQFIVEEALKSGIEDILDCHW